MANLPDTLAGAVSPTWYEEVLPWVRALHDKGEVGLPALTVDAAVARRDGSTVRQMLPQLRQGLAAIQAGNTKAYIAVLLVEDFATQVISRAQPLAQ